MDIRVQAHSYVPLLESGLILGGSVAGDKPSVGSDLEVHSV